MNKLVSRNPILRFKLGRKIVKALNGISFKLAWNNARNKKLRYFNWTDANGVTRMYNSKAAGNDSAYESFMDNMNEMSALLPTDTLPKHLGWERNNPTSSELRGKDRQINKQGTESTLLEITSVGTKKSKPVSKTSNSNNRSKNNNKATRNMSGTWGQGSGGGLQYANQRQYTFERSDFDKMRMKSSGIFGSTAYQTDNRGKRYVERDGVLYYDDGSYYNPLTRKTGKYTFTPGGLFSRNIFTLYKQGGQLPSRNVVERFKQGKKIVKALQGKILPTAPSVKERYSGGYRYLIPWMKKVRGPKTSMLVHPGEILLYVKEVTPYYNDTTYVEVPEHTSFVNIKPRVASTNSTEDLNSPILDKNGWPTGHYKFKFNNSPEYEILKRRFNTAWSLAK